MKATDKQKEAMRQRYQRKREEVLEQRREYYWANRERIRRSHSDWYQRNKKDYKARRLEERKQQRDAAKAERLSKKRCLICGGPIGMERRGDSLYCSDAHQLLGHRNSTADWAKRNPDKVKKYKRICRSRRLYGEYADAHVALLTLETKLKETTHGTKR